MNMELIGLVWGHYESYKAYTELEAMKALFADTTSYLDFETEKSYADYRKDMTSIVRM